MSNDSVERKVRALLERANHPGTPPAEAEAALAMAYRLMMKYHLDIRSLGSRTLQRLSQPLVAVLPLSDADT